jgi:heptosyltransferase-3
MDLPCRCAAILCFPWRDFNKIAWPGRFGPEAPGKRLAAVGHALDSEGAADGGSAPPAARLMRLLFIKLKHIGDALLLTPTLTAVRQSHPQATVWVVVRKGSESILSGCPAVDRVLTSAAPEAANRSAFGWVDDLKLLRELRRQHFDYAFELSYGDRGRWLASFSGAKARCTNGAVWPLSAFWRRRLNGVSQFDWRSRHQVEADFFTVKEFLPLQPAEPPPLVFEKALSRPCDLNLDLQDYALIHPATRWERKRWPIGNWIETGRALLQHVRQIVVSVGPAAEEVRFGETLAAALKPRALSTGGRLDWAQLAGLMYGARLFVGVDTAAMHLAAACQRPIVAVLGDTVVAQWRPWRAPHRLVQSRRCDPGLPPEGGAKLIQEVTVASVVAACEAALRGEFDLVLPESSR